MALICCEHCGTAHSSAEEGAACREAWALRELNRQFCNIGHARLSAALQAAYRRGRADGRDFPTSTTARASS